MSKRNPTALVTGASSGIGLEIAQELARRNYDVILVARREDKLLELASLLEKYVDVKVIPLNLALDEAPQQLYEKLRGRRIDMLVNNAGFGAYGMFATSDFINLNEMLHVNMVALTKLTRLFLPAMIAQGSGRIMNVSSIAAYFPGPLMAIYYASKAFVSSFSEALSNELAGTGVTVTCLCPGPTTSGFQEQAGIDELESSSRNRMTSRRVARRGVEATLRGDRVCIPGLINRALTILPRFLSRGAMLSIMRRVIEKVPKT
jgi:short-subunit dehydrogenase